MPTHHRAFAPEWQRAAADCDAKAAEIQEQVTRRHDATARPLSQLQIGNRVDLQDTDTGRWDRTGVVVGIGRRRTYLVKTASGDCTGGTGVSCAPTGLCWTLERHLSLSRPMQRPPLPPSPRCRLPLLSRRRLPSLCQPPLTHLQQHRLHLAAAAAIGSAPSA